MCLFKKTTILLTIAAIFSPYSFADQATVTLSGNVVDTTCVAKDSLISIGELRRSEIDPNYGEHGWALPGNIKLLENCEQGKKVTITALNLSTDGKSLESSNTETMGGTAKLFLSSEWKSERIAGSSGTITIDYTGFGIVDPALNQGGVSASYVFEISYL